MNYLAHLSLSFEDPYIMLGNFIADDISIKDIPEVSSPVLKGIMLHRQIDAYTDDHPAFKKSVNLLRANHSKYASVIVDIINDHFLALYWSRFYNSDIIDFHNQVYFNLEKVQSGTPLSSQKHVTGLLQYRYLHAYSSKEGITDVMMRMDKRTRFKSNFQGSVADVYDSYDAFKDNFFLLYQALVDELDGLLESAIQSIPQN